MPGDDEPVSPVVAGTAHDRDATRLREAREQLRGGGRAGHLHQRGTGQAGLLDRATVEFPEVFGPPQGLHGN